MTLLITKRQTMLDLFRPVPTGSRLVPEKVPTTSSQFPLSLSLFLLHAGFGPPAGDAGDGAGDREREREREGEREGERERGGRGMGEV